MNQERETNPATRQQLRICLTYTSSIIAFIKATVIFGWTVPKVISEEQGCRNMETQQEVDELQLSLMQRKAKKVVTLKRA